jgi:hypothetical protein
MSCIGILSWERPGGRLTFILRLEYLIVNYDVAD